MEIRLPAKPEEITLDIDKAALVVVDMQNAFCKKGGMMDFFGMLNTPVIERVIAADKKAIDIFRKKGIPIIYLRMTYGKKESPDSPFYLKEGGLKAMRENPGLEGKFLTGDTWGWQIIDELKPETGDIIIDKSRFSGFTRTGLDAALKKLKARYLFFIGAFTNICVESTIRDAFFHEYFPILIEDACGNLGPEFTQQATVFNVAQAFGWVTTSNDVIKSFSYL